MCGAECTARARNIYKHKTKVLCLDTKDKNAHQDVIFAPKEREGAGKSQHFLQDISSSTAAQTFGANCRDALTRSTSWVQED